MFSMIEKVVFTLVSTFVVLGVAGIILLASGFAAAAAAVLAAGVVPLSVGVIIGFFAFLKYLWFDA